MTKQTPLYDKHVQLGARLTDFSGWEMPLHYGSQIREHHAVRQKCGLFDVSHMGVVDVVGAGALEFLRLLLANDAGRLTRLGMCQYSLMLNSMGGIVDDLIVSRLAEHAFRLVVNAGTREKDVQWIKEQAAGHAVEIHERNLLAMVAVQGPESPAILSQAMSDWGAVSRIQQLTPFGALHHDDIFISRTGYTGETGFEVILPASQVVSLWERLMDAGAVPAGLGARDTLRLEAGLNLYGTDMNEETTPFECGLSWTLAWEPMDRPFMGRQILEPLRESIPSRRRLGLVLQEKGVLRNHQTVIHKEKVVGEITSGSYSPTLESGIAIARLDQRIKPGDLCQVEMRGRNQTALVVKLPFVRLGRSTLPTLNG
ncbi:MAG: glycine cleavage system aminomethyltransferase GcvT [Magnetococcales bacterium]|nr:glycine cleavage system aminomethyltransferase GcvT [Magnetococcales bacterium]